MSEGQQPVRSEHDGSPAVLSVRDLSIESRINQQRRTIVSAVDFDVGLGETVGIVGESGSGKSLTARAIVGLLPPGVVAAGKVLYENRDLLALPKREIARVRGTEVGLILQDPFTMLNPRMRSGRHVNEALRDERGRRLGRKAARAEAVRRLAEVGIHDPSVVERYPFQLSGGMRQRVCIAAALARDPMLLIADEPSTALDVTTQKEILGLIKSLQEARQMGLILITHDLRVAFSMCDRVYVLYAGSLLEVGPAAALEREPLHPYTLGLLLSEPPADKRLPELVSIRGSVPAPDDVPNCCSFSPRCRWVAPVCQEEKPALRPVAPGRVSACVRIEDIATDLRLVRQEADRSVHVVPTVTTASPVVLVDRLDKVFRQGQRGLRQDVVALAGVSLEVLLNESVGLVGESGSGKTTLARSLVGLERPTSGSILIDGIAAHDYEALAEGERRRLRRTIQIVFQDPYSSLNPLLSVSATLGEALKVGGYREGQLDQEVSTLLARVGLPDSYKQRRPVALSGGERQRVAIARALAVKPKVIVCDEPVSALDVSVQAQILNLLKSLREELEISYIFITHDLSVVRQVAERVYVLYRGEVVESGYVDDVLDNPRDPYTVKLMESVPRSERDWLRTNAPQG